VVAADRDVGAAALQHHSQHAARRLDDIPLVLHVICRAAVTCSRLPPCTVEGLLCIAACLSHKLHGQHGDEVKGNRCRALPAPSSAIDGMLMQQSSLSESASCPFRKGDSMAAKCVASAAMCPNNCTVQERY
jgi:hypothetical protein